MPHETKKTSKDSSKPQLAKQLMYSVRSTTSLVQKYTEAVKKKSTAS